MTHLRAVWTHLRAWEALLVVGSAVALVLLTADVVAGGLATYFDDEVYAALGAGADPASDAVSSVGGLGVSGAALLIVTLVTTHLTMRAWPLVLAVGTVGGGLLLMLGLKALVGRTAPGQSALPDGYPGYFPSGHTATAGLCLGTAWFVLATWRGYGRRLAAPATSGLLVGVVSGAVVGAAAVTGGYHWATDALGGLLIVTLVLPLGFAACAVYAARPDDVPRPRQTR